MSKQDRELDIKIYDCPLFALSLAYDIVNRFVKGEYGELLDYGQTVIIRTDGYLFHLEHVLDMVEIWFRGKEE